MAEVEHHVEGHPQAEELRQNSWGLLTYCAQAQNVAPERFQAWGTVIGDPSTFLSRLQASLARLVPPDAWLFHSDDL